MEYTKLYLEELETKIQYSTFICVDNIKEYHFIINIYNPSLFFQQQIENIDKTLAYIQSNILNDKTSLVWSRYFLSDPVNQFGYLNLPKNSAVSITGQPPLNNTKVALWCYYVENVQIEKEKEVTILKHSGYEHFYYTGLNYIRENNEYQQTKEIFSQLKESFSNRNISFVDNLIRTWIYVQGVDTHYSEMVEARKELFLEEGLNENTHYIASTGIEGRYIHPESLIFMDTYAVKGLKKEQVNFLKALDYLSPTNQYGVTFERGTKIQFGDRSHIFISGTASIDKYGEIIAPHDIINQTQRTFENIQALLQEGNADIKDIAHLIIYLRDTADYTIVKNYIEMNYPDIPKIFVLAPVCRPGWLIEIECIAISPETNKTFPSF